MRLTQYMELKLETNQHFIFDMCIINSSGKWINELNMKKKNYKKKKEIESDGEANTKIR